MHQGQRHLHRAVLAAAQAARGGCSSCQRLRTGRDLRAPYDHIAIKDFAFDSYVVAVRDDRPRAYLCDHQVVETAANATRPNDHFIPMWSQPTTRPRDPARGTAIKTLVFKGLTDRNLAPQFRDPVFFETLAEMGVEFRPTPPGSDTEQMIDWADFREA